MSYQVVLDLDLCDGHARCVAAAPSVFDLGEDDDAARVLDEHPPDSERAAVEAAVRNCPKGAVSIVADLVA